MFYGSLKKDVQIRMNNNTGNEVITPVKNSRNHSNINLRNFNPIIFQPPKQADYN